jgi:four helix bundle protein
MGPSIARQLARAATAPAAIVSRSPESRVPSARASQLCLKELREALTWLELVCALRLVRPAKVSQLLRETHHLIALFEATVNDHG